MPTWYVRPPKRDQNLGKDIRTKVTNGNHIRNRQGGVITLPIAPAPIRPASGRQR